MIKISSNSIPVKSSSKELFTFFGSLSGIAECFNYRKVKHLAIKDDKVEFILKRAATFRFKIQEITEEYVQIESIKDVAFMIAIRFDIQSKENGSEIQVHFETNTNPIIDFTFRRPANDWFQSIVSNIEKKFNG